MGTKFRNIEAEVYRMDNKDVEGFIKQLEAIGYDFSELKEKVEEHPKYKKFLEKYVSDALGSYFPPNYNPDVEEIAKARIDICSQVDGSKLGIVREFLEAQCRDMTITFKI